MPNISTTTKFFYNFTSTNPPAQPTTRSNTYLLYIMRDLAIIIHPETSLRTRRIVAINLTYGSNILAQPPTDRWPRQPESLGSFDSSPAADKRGLIAAAYLYAHTGTSA